jgi:hypothetical protein
MVDYTDILDRSAQELGESVHAFIAALERMRGRQLELARLKRELKPLYDTTERECAALQDMAGANARRGSDA